MGRDGAEGTTAEASAMEADGKLNHLVGRDAFAFVFGMGQTSVGEVERTVKFILGERLIGWVDDGITSIDFLDDALSGIFVGFFLDVSEVLGLCPFVAEALFVTVQEDVVGTDAARDFVLL